MRRDEADAVRAREQYKLLSPREKLDHLWTYYKWYYILGLATLIILGSVVWRIATRKDNALCLGFSNLTISQELDAALTDGFLESQGLTGEKQLMVYRGLFLSEDASLATHETAYATHLKVMASIENKTLDLLLVSKEGWDILSHSGYLLELPELLARDPALSARLLPLVGENEVVLSDNAIEVQLGEASRYEAETRPARNALDVSDSPLLTPYGFDAPVYLVVIANTPRPEACLAYIAYLMGTG